MLFFKKKINRIYIYIILIVFGAFFVFYKITTETKFANEPLTPESLARLAVETYINDGKKVILKNNLIGVETKKAGVFVTIYKKSNNAKELRGCMGTEKPMYKDIKSEIIANAISSATEDPRFPRTQKEELKELIYLVDILSPLEEVNSKAELNHKKYGIVLTTASGKKGVLLPDLDKVKSVEEQIRIAKYQSGIKENEQVKIQRFSVKRFSESLNYNKSH
ncbi:MAG TPA: AmmeMemoRadiSam system protein A [Candidatus Gastranaerophilales bacterium]|nr:AmmeMemoRadiSam system protein A [Candidatus Gastranaerophilales bacterium]